MSEENKRFWLRQYEITVGKPGSTGYLLKSEGLERPLHIKFSLEKSDTQSSNNGQLTITNLNDEHKALLYQEGCYVTLKAGYSGTMGTIFSGAVSDIKEDYDGGSNDVQVEVVDGFESNDVVGDISISDVVTGKQVVDEILDQMGVMSRVYTDVAASALESAKYDNGYCYVGKLKVALQKACQKAGVTFTQQNGVMQVFTKGETINSVAYVLSNRSGLMTIPKKIMISDNSSTSKKSSKKTSTSSTASTDSTTVKTKKSSAHGSSKGGTTKRGIPGYEVTYFLNPNIGVNDRVYLQSGKVTGTFRVKKISMDGDNYEGDWKCTAQLVSDK